MRGDNQIESKPRAASAPSPIPLTICDRKEGDENTRAQVVLARGGRGGGRGHSGGGTHRHRPCASAGAWPGGKGRTRSQRYCNKGCDVACSRFGLLATPARGGASSRCHGLVLCDFFAILDGRLIEASSSPGSRATDSAIAKQRLAGLPARHVCVSSGKGSAATSAAL